MAHLFEPLWSLCDLAGDSLWGREGASAVLNPPSYSRLLGSVLVPGASWPTSKFLHLPPMTQGVDGAFVSAGLTLL
jgi:hypothetical protein